jgi:hypothetical protein
MVADPLEETRRGGRRTGQVLTEVDPHTAPQSITGIQLRHVIVVVADFPLGAEVEV